jgi:hypothetical protein
MAILLKDKCPECEHEFNRTKYFTWRFSGLSPIFKCPKCQCSLISSLQPSDTVTHATKPLLFLLVPTILVFFTIYMLSYELWIAIVVTIILFCLLVRVNNRIFKKDFGHVDKTNTLKRLL